MYQIEVVPIDSHRWRAYIVRVPGVPTALMPFYGPTPDQAAGNLLDWLARAHARAASAIARGRENSRAGIRWKPYNSPPGAIERGKRK